MRQFPHRVILLDAPPDPCQRRLEMMNPCSVRHGMQQILVCDTVCDTVSFYLILRMNSLAQATAVSYLTLRVGWQRGDPPTMEPPKEWDTN